MFVFIFGYVDTWLPVKENSGIYDHNHNHWCNKLY